LSSVQTIHLYSSSTDIGNSIILLTVVSRL
jgi:hypothetical protein